MRIFQTKGIRKRVGLNHFAVIAKKNSMNCFLLSCTHQGPAGAPVVMEKTAQYGENLFDCTLILPS